MPKKSDDAEQDKKPVRDRDGKPDAEKEADPADTFGSETEELR
ncbi:hypothetical protein ABIB90_005273 [Bradyrhizobium sp. JR4.1]